MLSAYARLRRTLKSIFAGHSAARRGVVFPLPHLCDGHPATQLSRSSERRRHLSAGQHAGLRDNYLASAARRLLRQLLYRELRSCHLPRRFEEQVLLASPAWRQMTRSTSSTLFFHRNVLMYFNPTLQDRVHISVNRSLCICLRFWVWEAASRFRHDATNALQEHREKRLPVHCTNKVIERDLRGSGR